MASRLRILISNDDGYDAEGLLALAREMRKIADVRICAPLSNMSGTSSSLSLAETVTVSIDGDRVVVHGTPTDCVHIALVTPDLLPWRPDLTVSGINHGNNIGDDAMYSGTIAAAAESVQIGVPSIAFSIGSIPQVHWPPKHYDDAAIFARKLVVGLADKLLDNKGTMLNVNIPDMPESQLKKPVVCKLGMSHLHRAIEPVAVKAETGQADFRIGDPIDPAEGYQGTDLEAIEAGHVAVTPLAFDLTDGATIGRVTQWLRS